MGPHPQLGFMCLWSGVRSREGFQRGTVLQPCGSHRTSCYRKPCNREHRIYARYRRIEGIGCFDRFRYMLLPGRDRQRVRTQIDNRDDALVFRVDARDQSFVGARDP